MFICFAVGQAGRKSYFRLEGLNSDFSLIDHWGKYQTDRIVFEVVTGELVIIIIISIGTIIPAVMHGQEFHKTDITVLAMMLEIMSHQLR